MEREQKLAAEDFEQGDEEEGKGKIRCKAILVAKS